MKAIHDFVSTAKKYIEPHVRQVILGKLNTNTPYTVLLQTVKVISAERFFLMCYNALFSAVLTLLFYTCTVFLTFKQLLVILNLI